MNRADDTIFEQAARWHLASAGDGMDWDGFTRWLEADPRHHQAYDRIALAAAALDDHRSALTALAEEASAQPSSPKWPLWSGGALAASLAMLLIVPQFTAPDPQSFASGPAPLQIALQDGSKVFLGPQSRLTVAGRHGEQLALQGGAFFAIRHNAARRMTIGVGGLEIGDIGTRFDVQTDSKIVRVEVSQGRVELRGEALGKPIDLPAGRGILFDPAHEVATVAAVREQDVGEWREGRLTYDAAPLSLVAADLTRYAGVSVKVPAPLAGRRFSGTLSIRHGDSAVRDLAQLMGLDVSRRGRSYQLAERR
jgi:transmembrane sensor